MGERVVVVNASKMNYDHALDFSILLNCRMKLNT